MSVFSRFVRTCCLGLLTLALSVPSLVHAQLVPGGLPESDKQQIKSYTLNEDVFGRLAAATREARAQGIPPQGPPDSSKVHNLDDLAKQAMAGDPRIPALVAKYGFTPREFILANIALTNAVMVAQSRNDVVLAGNLNTSWSNADNVRFVDTHKADIMALMQGH
ncbi:hypothetical protein [Dyella sp. ASV21]|uniref:hypothetical protein n=1 Tax=Dyella sp. ASV21 TaxID=2795114 RepID=UPI0018EBD8E3|nr:hypothetical protein [Dyella sp. ASV21]